MCCVGSARIQFGYELSIMSNQVFIPSIVFFGAMAFKSKFCYKLVAVGSEAPVTEMEVLLIPQELHYLEMICKPPCLLVHIKQLELKNRSSNELRLKCLRHL